jgi:quercetin dioxygenase-like cupin family protein
MPAWAHVDPGPIRARSSGDLVFMPRDTPHNFTAMEQQAARYLLINTPGSPAKSRRRYQRRTSKYARAMA